MIANVSVINLSPGMLRTHMDKLDLPKMRKENRRKNDSRQRTSVGSFPKEFNSFPDKTSTSKQPNQSN